MLISQSTGGIFGSKLINDRFEQHVKSVVGNEDFAKLQGSRPFRQGMMAFNDSVKPGFRITQRRPRTLTFPQARLKDNVEKGLERDTLKITW